MQKVRSGHLVEICGLEKGYAEAFTDSYNGTYGEGIGQVMTQSVKK